jgi:two-component system OmpR family response regulator
MDDQMPQARIVIVDDDPDFLEYTRIVLRSAGYQVDTATGAAEGLALIRSVAPDLIISDVMMSYSVEEGISLAHEITHDPALADIPLCVVTSIARTLDSVGFDEKTVRAIQCFLTKPVSPEELLTRIGFYLAERRKANGNRCVRS